MKAKSEGYFFAPPGDGQVEPERALMGAAELAKRRRSMAYAMKCGVCGKFCGVYPVGFYCDHHCYRCICTRCPVFTRPPSPGAWAKPSETPPRGPSGDSVSFPLTNTVEDEERASWADREP